MKHYTQIAFLVKTPYSSEHLRRLKQGRQRKRIPFVVGRCVVNFMVVLCGGKKNKKKKPCVERTEESTDPFVTQTV